ncbi:MAG: GspH/FimT family pseudopilin [Magnetococcales bacterium]|nr:GspH/FimT family pseudopilin [Magnetococcales bacterium]
MSACQPDSLNREMGYTLTEMLVALAILAVLVALALPSLTTLVQENRLTTYSNLLTGALQLARSEAVKRGSSITLCSSNNGLTCGGSWQDGWIILVGATPLQNYPSLEGRVTLRYALSSGNNSDRIQFNARGFSPAHAGTWTFCDSRGTRYARALIVNSSGRIITARDSNHNGIAEDDLGQDLYCS